MLRVAMERAVRGFATSPNSGKCRRLEGKVAIVTASTQGYVDKNQKIFTFRSVLWIPCTPASFVGS